MIENAGSKVYSKRVFLIVRSSKCLKVDFHIFNLIFFAESAIQRAVKDAGEPR